MKRPPPNTDDCGSSGSKKRRRMSISEDDDSSRPPTNQCLEEAPPLHKIYNSSCRKEKPDELFRKDLISAMKLPDSEQLDEKEFWAVSDSWKQEWERGVQVPVNSKNVPNPNVRIIREQDKNGFKLPKKFMRTEETEFFSQERHVLIDTAAKAENVCKYDMDNIDCKWLHEFNCRRQALGLPAIENSVMERVLEDFETQCSNRFQDALKTEKGLGIEYDEDVICDVCRSPDCEEGNEMVFCDSCNICVHQACYGIMAIPEGSWVCKPCAANVKPSCTLCPNTGGAMKNTSSGDKWAHVSCALWVPEVSIGCPEKMEPITRISHIPTSRWALICSICRERVGACIQCSVKQCKVAYHVTCAFEDGLEMEMKTTALDSSEEGVKMQSFCPKHCKTEGVERSPPKTKKKTSTRKKKEVKNKDIVENEVDEHNARLQKIRSLEAQFHRYVSTKDTADLHHIESQTVDFLYNYWVLKRSAKFNKPLLITKCDEANLLIKQHENLLYSRLKMFVHLRQDLERVRNLCYMVSRREKIFRSFMRAKRDIFEKQIEILTNKSFKLNPKEVEEVSKARVGSTLFEKFYCSDVEEETDEASNKNASQAKLPNPYAKSYVNNVHTRSRRRTTSQNLSDPVNENFDSESNEMPTLVKCKSEENLSSAEMNDKSEPPTFTNSRLIKLESEPKNDEQSSNVKQERKSSTEAKDKKHKNSSLSREHHNQLEPKDPEMPKINSENLNTRTRKPSSSVESTNDKNSLCLSDKENINALNPIKIKKTRSQADARHQDFKNSIHELTHPKLELFDEESLTNEIGSSDEKKSFRFDKQTTRYPKRNRRCSQDIQENGDTPSKSLDSNDAKIKHSPPTLELTFSPSNSVNGLTFLSPDKSPSSQPETPRRRRGRPRKIAQIEVPPDVSFTVIKTEVMDIDSDKNNSCDGLVSDSSESPGFRMSLRHAREHSSLKKTSETKSKKRSVGDKTEHPDATPLKEANKDIEDCWDADNARPPTLSSPEQPSFERIVIRLRKDANGESWKNNSSSSESFSIVHDELNNCDDSASQFPSVIKYSGSLHNQSFPGDCESRHRYLMRERTVTPSTAKTATQRS